MNYYCRDCGKLLAQVKEGSMLRKGIVFLCQICYDKLKTENMFNDLFGGFKK